VDAIEIDGLTKKFGDVLALDHLNLTVKKNSVFGFLGPNGAGKTTTLRLLVGLAKPTSGTAKILGYNIKSQINKIYPRIGFLPDIPVFYGWMTAKEYLNFVADIFKIPHKKREKKIDYLLEITNLKEVKTKIKGYSRGMKKKLGIAQALINDPEVIFMDEPTSALDPIGRKEILEMMTSLGKETTVFFSTHILNDVERICDSVAILHEGRLVTEESLESLKTKYSKPIFTLEFDDRPDKLTKILKNMPWIENIEQYNNALKVTSKNLKMGQKELPNLIAKSNLSLKSFQIEEPSLEDIFVKIVGG